MLKRTLNLIIALFLAVISTSFVGDLQYKNVLGNNIKVLIPDNFIHVSKNEYKLHYQGDQGLRTYTATKIARNQLLS